MAEAQSWTAAQWIELDEVDSTNAEAMRRAVAGARGPLYIRADRQTAGRGRSGRVWQLGEGNLALSRLGRVGCTPGEVPQLSFVAGVALYRTTVWALGDGGGGGRLTLKWPNDVLLDGAKLGGILIEATRLDDALMAVIGIGLNTCQAPEIPGRRTASLSPVAVKMGSPRAFASLVARHLEDGLALWDDGHGFSSVRDAWLAGASPEGTQMSIETPEGRVSGRFLGLDEDGSLLMSDQHGDARRFSYGDVTLASEREMS